MNAILLLVLIAADPSDYYAGATVAASASDYYMPVAAPKVEEEPKVAPKPSAPAPRAGYPVRGSWWTHPGSGRAGLIHHLQSGVHTGKFSEAWLNSLSLAELESLHSDDHEHRVKAPSVNRPAAAMQEPAALTEKEKKKIEKEVGRAVYGTADGKHPGPLGSAIRGFFGDPRYTRSYSSGCPNGRCPR